VLKKKKKKGRCSATWRGEPDAIPGPEGGFQEGKKGSEIGGPQGQKMGGANW